MSCGPRTEMSLTPLFYTVEQANDLLEYSDISDDNVDVPEAFLQSQASDNVSDRN